MAETAGYSGKPLAQKLGVKAGQTLALRQFENSSHGVRL